MAFWSELHWLTPCRWDGALALPIFAQHFSLLLGRNLKMPGKWLLCPQKYLWKPRLAALLNGGEFITLCMGSRQAPHIGRCTGIRSWVGSHGKWMVVIFPSKELKKGTFGKSWNMVMGMPNQHVKVMLLFMLMTSWLLQMTMFETPFLTGWNKNGSVPMLKLLPKMNGSGFVVLSWNDMMMGWVWW